MNSPAYNAGVRAGDVIVRVNQSIVENDHIFKYLIGIHEEGDVIKLSIVRDGTFFSTEAIAVGLIISNPNE